MRTEAEILRAHDLLVQVITGKVPNPFGKDRKAPSLLMANCDVLCWLLQHDHNTTFADNIAKLETWLREEHGLVAAEISEYKKHESDRPGNE